MIISTCNDENAGKMINLRLVVAGWFSYKGYIDTLVHLMANVPSNGVRWHGVHYVAGSMFFDVHVTCMTSSDIHVNSP